MMKAFALNEGSYSVDASKKFIPFDPQIHNPKDRPASLFVHVQPFLIDMGDELLLLDTGLGYADESGKLFLHKHIKALGYHPQDVSKVLMSHLHFDHAGGMLQKIDGEWKPSFPDAEYFIQQNEMDYALAGNSKSYRKEMLEVLRRSGNIQFLDGEGALGEHIHYEITGAHCPYHQVFLISKEGKKYFFGGDEMPEAIQVQRKFIAKYDYDGRKAMELREYFAQKAVVEDWYCLMYHDKKHGIVQFAKENGAFVIR